MPASVRADVASVAEDAMARKGIYPFIPLQFERLEVPEQRQRAASFEDRLRTRRTVRHFSADPVPFGLVETAIRVAGRAPSGANQQPWRFVVVSNPELKRQIRQAAEAEERTNYEKRFPDQWLQALAPLGTDWTPPAVCREPTKTSNSARHHRVGNPMFPDKCVSFCRLLAAVRELSVSWEPG
jgi:nitroreductase